MAIGLVTGLATVMFWVLVTASSWDAVAVRAGWIAITFVPVVALLVAALAGVPMMDARCRLDDRRRDVTAR